jgi:hypothetical protein
MQKISSDTRGYAKVKKAAKYADVGERTFRDWLNNGLRHIRLPSGTIIIPFALIGEYLLRFEVSTNELDEIVDQAVRELKS